MKNQHKIILVLFLVTSIIFGICSCREADRASYNISREADNFNIVRRITVIDCINGDECPYYYQDDNGVDKCSRCEIQEEL